MENDLEEMAMQKRHSTTAEAVGDGLAVCFSPLNVSFEFSTRLTAASMKMLIRRSRCVPRERFSHTFRSGIRSSLHGWTWPLLWQPSKSRQTWRLQKRVRLTPPPLPPSLSAILYRCLFASVSLTRRLQRKYLLTQQYRQLQHRKRLGNLEAHFHLACS